MRRLMLVGLLMGMLAGPAVKAAPDVVQSRMTVPAGWLARVQLAPAERQALAARGPLRVALSAREYPPFELAGDGQHYEGASADVVAVLAQALGVPLQVVPVADRAAAFRALAEGRADIVTSANAAEAAAAGARLSVPYLPDQAVLVRRVDDDSAGGELAGLRLAVADGYLPLAKVQALYPAAQVRYYPSLLAALGAVAFGQADAALGNALAMRSQLGRSQLNNLRLAHFPATESTGLGLALNPADPLLPGAIDQVLRGLGEPLRLRLLRSWGFTEQVPPNEVRLALTAEEREWIAAHPKVKVALNSHYVPVAWFEDGQLRGIAGDVLARISQLTGLHFEPVARPDLPGLLGALAQGQVALAASVPATEALRERMGFSRHWLTSSQVLVSRAGSAPLDGLESLAGKRLAIPQSSPSWDSVGELAPAVERVQAGGDADSLQRLAQGRVDAALLPLISARALIARDYSGQLKIDGPLPVEPVRYRFALPLAPSPLGAILDKALHVLNASEIEDISRRWRGGITVGVAPWPRYAAAVVAALVAALLAWLLALAWINSLRRQIRRRSAAEAALNEQLEFMRVMIDGTPHPVYVRDRDGRLLNCNTSYLQALGVGRDEVIGRRPSESLPLAAGQAEAFETFYRAALARGEAVFGDRKVHLRHGPSLTVHHWLLPYRDAEGGIAGMICGWVDMTERQRLYEQLRLAKDAADAANQAKSRFLATASHEIRTPMNAVLGMLELARRSAEQGQVNCLAIDVANDAAKGLLELLNDVLDVTRLEGGHLALQPQPLHLDRLFAGCVQLFQAQARHKGLTLSWHSKGEAWGVLADPLRLRQVLGNLLSNAIKFTPTGQVQVRLEGQACEGQLNVTLTVSDSGIGIPPEELARLGQPYCQASNHGQAGRAGAGLGLSISQHLAKLMDGQLRLRSELGKGTRAQLSLRLPLAQVPGEAAVEPAWQVPVAPVALDILVVDDYPPNRLLLDQQLRYLGHHVVLAADGPTALALWRDGRFDRVICDCQMPGMDGFALARAIREEEQRLQRMPVRLLGCTADSQGDAERACLAAGMDACLLKPLALATLAEALAGPSGPPVAAMAVYEPQSLKRLAAGDDTAAQRLRESLLESLRADIARLREVGADHQVLHRMLGGARIVRAQPLIDACEAAQRDGTLLPQVLAAAQQLSDALQG